MEKVKLEIVGLSYSQTQSGAYALVLAEVGGKRRLPIIIGGFEAQAIAIELEKMVPTRPLTHDLFKSFATSFTIIIKEIIIYKLVEGIFYAKIVCEKDGFSTEIDARTSDAVAIGVRFNCPIYTFENIISSAGILLDETDETEEPIDILDFDDEVESTETVEKKSIQDIEDELQAAIDSEDYELASKLRDEINKRTS
ncbi:bifunctional nuclease family protein [Crocinitomicaceae bacterium]|jgi:bifunctional DNase/RNase|nr:bifunctional nuclease family protein [Crocinitomicaceae bacterium]MDG1347912.1 bifunctional nuclease family protein [Crocinitomicaceae bacterium]MDG2463540.1 bifunctional nuclease family protein [Crocinitomicaceae bacterium]